MMWSLWSWRRVSLLCRGLLIRIRWVVSSLLCEGVCQYWGCSTHLKYRLSGRMYYLTIALSLNLNLFQGISIAATRLAESTRFSLGKQVQGRWFCAKSLSFCCWEVHCFRSASSHSQVLTGADWLDDWLDDYRRRHAAIMVLCIWNLLKFWRI